MGEIDIAGIDKVALVQALYAAARPVGLGALQYQPGPLPDTEAQELAQRDYISYCHGRVMKVDISGDTFDPRLYDRDNGVGMAQSVVDALRAAPVTDTPQEA